MKMDNKAQSQAEAQTHEVEEKTLRGMNGILMLIVAILMLIISIFIFLRGVAMMEYYGMGLGNIILAVVLFIAGCIMFGGLHQVNPNEALILVLFGKYHGTIKKAGYYFVNPFASALVPASWMAEKDDMLISDTKKKKKTVSTVRKRISLKVNTLNNEKQKVNDVLGNPIIIGTIVIWKVVDPTKAVFNVENYTEYLSTQCDSIVRNVARQFPYDNMDEEDRGVEMSGNNLREGSQEIADLMQEELSKRVEKAGIEILDVRITNLAYSEEIAAAMLQRQQATAILAAKKKIVEGAVGMVKNALEKLDEDEVVVLDDERKAAMVSNLLVVLCGNKDAQPVINNGSIY